MNLIKHFDLESGGWTLFVSLAGKYFGVLTRKDPFERADYTDRRGGNCDDLSVVASAAGPFAAGAFLRERGRGEIHEVT